MKKSSSSDPPIQTAPSGFLPSQKSISLLYMELQKEDVILRCVEKKKKK